MVVRLPGHDRVVVDAAKVRDYLLSDAHPVGRFKAAFFHIRGSLKGPSARSAPVITVWIVPVGMDVARFVTAYPE